MAEYYLIRGNQIVSTLDADAGDVIALPLFGGGDAMSLLNQQHAQHLVAALGGTVQDALDALGLADLRDTALKSVVVGPDPASVSGTISGIVAYHLIAIGDYALWQCDGQPDDLLRLHNLLWQREPAQSLGLLAVVQEFGSVFYPAAVRTATGMTSQQALQRRDRLASYLESLGYGNTASLRAATDEHAQTIGVVAALGHTEQQLWTVMAE